MASSETQNYVYSFDIHESPLEEDDRWELITVKLCLWKFDGSAADTAPPAVEVTRRQCDLNRLEMDYEEPVWEVSAYLTELGFPEECQRRMIARLWLCIDIYIIRRHRYRHMTVFMDIIHESVRKSTFIEGLKSLKEPSDMRSIEDIERPRRYWINVGHQCQRWSSESEYGDLAELVWYLMDHLSIWSDWLHVPWELDDDLVDAVNESLEEYTPQMKPATEEAIADLETLQEGDGKCLICQDEDEEEELGFSKIPHCGHVFHTGCVKTWLRISCYCRLCKYALPHINQICTESI